jgi:hypothetical protein
MGDSVLGGDEYMRFVPMRFNHKAEALDNNGAATADMACPRCHMEIIPPLLEVPPLFISIIGAPASGKSYFLATMTWELRRLLPRAGISFTDADALGNAPLREYEDSLFMNPRPDQPTEIRKTQQHDTRLHKTAIMDGSPVRLPLPMQFSLWPTSQHPHYREPYRVGRVIVCYDNAGEDCLPGADVSGPTVVRHLAESSALFMLYDPLQDPRFRRLAAESQSGSADLRGSETAPAGVLTRQEMVLNEMASRIRRFLGLSQNQRLSQPLIVIVSKFDILSHPADIDISQEPYKGLDTDEGPLALNVQRVEDVSRRLETLFRRISPEFATVAEALSDNVTYIPVSSLGCSPRLVQTGERQFYGVRPADIHPKWVTVPLLYCMTRHGYSLLSHSRVLR